jgi:small-conductance mechanosensitive channel/CRP-like cAMP-binding protein
VHSAAISVVLLIGVVVALVISRSRGLTIRVSIEAVLLLAIGAFLLWQGTSPLPPIGSPRLGVTDAWARALAVTWWLIGARLVVNVTLLVRGRDPKSREARLFSDLAAAVIYLTTVLIILNSVLDLNVRGLLVTSGVIAIAVGLALQSTLADVFSGIAVSLEQPFRLGDRVSLSDNIEGVVVQVNWRSIHVRTDDDDLATIPNSIVAKGQIINHSVPTRRRAGTVEIITPADAASDVVVQLIWQASLLCPLILADPPASITLRRSGIRTCTYAVNFFVADSPDASAAKSMLLRQTRRLFRYAGIAHAEPMSSIDSLRSLALFEALSEAQLESLAKDLVLHVVEPGDTIFEEGSIAHSLYVIEAGVMEARRREAKSLDYVSSRLGAGDYAGELGLITGTPRACTLKALTRGRVQELRGDRLGLLLKSNAALSKAMEQSVHRRLAAIQREDAAAAHHSPEHAVDLMARIREYFHV